MSGQFEWQTEDEDEWTNLPSDRFTKSAAAKGRKHWRFVLVLIITASLTGVIIYWRVQSTVQQAEESRSADILSSYRLIEEAIRTNDTELFMTLLSGADLGWADSQQELLRRDWAEDRRFMGFGQSPIERQAPTIELAPDLNSAVVSSEHNYAISIGNGTRQLIRLKQDSVYRRGQRWLLAPPTETFWGGAEPVNQSGSILSVTYPERDRPTIEPILADIDQALVQLCQSTEFLACPTALKVDIEFSTDPESLTKIHQSYFDEGFFGMGLRRPGTTIKLTLPTPTLVGIPLDEVSFQAILRGYKAYAAGAILSWYFDEACCENDQITRAMIQSLLVDQGIMPWPIEGPVGDDFNNLGDGDYDLQVMCHDATSNKIDLYRLNGSTGEWQVAMDDRDLVDMQGLPTGDGVALLEKIQQANDTILIRLLAFQNGQEFVLSEQYLENQEGKATRFEIRDREQKLILEVPRLREGFSDFSILDLADCDNYECTLETYSLFGRPYWSPEGDQWLVREFGQLYRREGYMSSLVSDGFAPFWINSSEFGYVRQVGDEQFIVVMNTGVSEPELIIPISTFSEQLPNLHPGTQLKIGLIMPDPTQPMVHWYILFFLVNRVGNLQDAVLMDFDLMNNKTEIVHRSDQLNRLALAPMGGKMAISFYNPLRQHWQMLLHHTGDSEDLVYSLSSGSSLSQAPSMAWSPDGQWLALLNKGVLTVLSGERRQQFDIIPPVPGCINAAWIKTG